MSLQSVNRAFDIIELLSRTPKGMTLSEMADSVSLPVSTVYRIAGDLVLKGYVHKSSDLNIYKIGLKFIDLTALFISHLELKTEAHPFLMELARQVGFPVFLATLMDGEVCYIDRIAPADADRGFSIVGQKRPVFSTALGKALVLNWNDTDLMRLLSDKGMARHTPYTITDPDAFCEDIHLSKERGWAQDNREDRLDFQCVGVPVYDFRNNIVASISTSWNKKYFGKTDIPGVASLVRLYADRISSRLGSRFNKEI